MQYKFVWLFWDALYRQTWNGPSRHSVKWRPRLQNARAVHVHGVCTYFLALKVKLFSELRPTFWANCCRVWERDFTVNGSLTCVDLIFRVWWSLSQNNEIQYYYIFWLYRDQTLLSHEHLSSHSTRNSELAIASLFFSIIAWNFCICVTKQLSHRTGRRPPGYSPSGARKKWLKSV